VLPLTRLGPERRPALFRSRLGLLLPAGARWPGRVHRQLRLFGQADLLRPLAGPARDEAVPRLCTVAFGKFGKRGVGYNIESLLGEIRKILRTQGQHNIALIGAGRLGQAIASSSIFAEHGINIAAVFDTDAGKVGRSVGHVTVSPYETLSQAVRDKNIIVGVMAVPPGAAQSVAEDLIQSGVKIIFNYSEALLDVPPDVQVHTSNPPVELLTALYFQLR
jgi:NADH/NAD ratio-sensing transcriptional regulator Rex